MRRSPILRSSGLTYQPLFLINEPDICLKTRLFLSIYNLKARAPSHFDQRSFLRNSWASPSSQLDFNFPVVFLLGDPQDDFVQSNILHESRNFHDIIQADFRDAYENLTSKEMSGLFWIKTYCQNAVIVIKAVDDLLIKPWSLLSLDSIQKYHLNFTGTGPQRICQSWLVHGISRFRTIRTIYLPDVLSGTCAHHDERSSTIAVRRDADAALLYVGDVFVTGIVADHERMNVPWVDEPSFMMDL